MSILVVGGSIAGVTAANELRAQGYADRVRLVADEPHPPYTRPPLSKAILYGAAEPSSAALALAEDVELVEGRAAALDLGRRVVRLEDGRELSYDGLVVATGAHARRLPPGPAGRTYRVLRTMDDALSLRAELGQGPRRVAICGAGPLGMEIASTCRALGHDVRVFDPRPSLGAHLGSVLGSLLTAAAEDAGVPVERRVAGLDDTADLWIAAVGDVPATGWLRDSGLALDPGLVVDDRLFAAPGIVGAGDVVSLPGAGRRPLWNQALDQAVCAVRSLLGDGETYVSRPYFWTEQFGLAVKVCGRVPVDGEPDVLEGSLRERSCMLQWRVGGEPVAAATMNHRVPLPRLRRLATSDRRPPGATVESPTTRA